MKSAFVPVCVSVLILGLFASPALCGEVVVVSPSTISLNSQGTCVTAHAEIPFSVVVPGSVTLEGLAATSIFPDDRGDLVAKFDVKAVKDLLAGPLGTAKEAYVPLTLCGEAYEDVGDTEDGETYSFSGTDTVRVIREGGKQK